MYRAKKDDVVYWVWQDGRAAIQTRIGDDSDIVSWTPEVMIARYGDPRKAFQFRQDVIPPGITLDDVLHNISYISFFRFPVDPQKGSLPAVINKAIETGNRYGISLVDNPILDMQQRMDIAATLCPQGENSNLFKEFPPSSEGFSTDRNNPTKISIPNPPFGLISYRLGSTTYWLYNTWGEEHGGSKVPGGGSKVPDGNKPDGGKVPDTNLPKPDPVPDGEKEKYLISPEDLANFNRLKEFLPTVVKEIYSMEEEANRHHPNGGGRFVQRIRNLAKIARNAGIYYVLLLSCLSFLSSGCAAFRAIIPGGVTPSDSEWSGVKSGQPISIAASLDSRSAVIGPILALLGQGDPLGTLLPVMLVGETVPRYIICDADLSAKCASIPLNAQVHFAGSAIGPGILWKPKRLTADDFDD